MSIASQHAVDSRLPDADYGAAMTSAATAAMAGASGSGVQAIWAPPIPSMASLPVDISKTEPKPAYYKLQFGDDYTGFSYYVRTLAVVIGRQVVSTACRAC